MKNTNIPLNKFGANSNEYREGLIDALTTLNYHYGQGDLECIVGFDASSGEGLARYRKQVGTVERVFHIRGNILYSHNHQRRLGK